MNLVAICARCGAKNEHLTPAEVWPWFDAHEPVCMPRPAPWRPNRKERRNAVSRI